MFARLGGVERRTDGRITERGKLDPAHRDSRRQHERAVVQFFHEIMAVFLAAELGEARTTTFVEHDLTIGASGHTASVVAQPNLDTRVIAIFGDNVLPWQPSFCGWPAADEGCAGWKPTLTTPPWQASTARSRTWNVTRSTDGCARDNS